MKDGAKYLLGLLLAALLLWWVLRGVDAKTMWAAIREASWGGLLIAALLNGGHNVFRVWRWQSLLAPVRERIPFRPMFTAVILGYTVTWVIPGRLGELVRPALLSARERVPLGACMGSVLGDRLMDGVAVTVLFAAGTWFVPLEGPVAEHAAVMRSSAVVFVAIMAVLLGVLLGAAAARSRIEAWIEPRGRLIRRVGRVILSFSDGVQALRSPRLLIRIVAHSFLAWLTIGLGTWVGVRAAGADVSFAAVLVILPMLALGVAVPTPGGAGSYHGAMKFGLMLFGVSQIFAVSAGLLMHVMITVPVILVGVVLIQTEKLSWKDLLSAARQIRALGADAGGTAGSSPVGEVS